MNFLNEPLAWGAFAAAIPLILHILNRSRFRRVEWGAIHLLESVVKVNHKRFRFEQLLLLLVRCTIPALLAFCLARPVLTGARMLTGDAPVSMVVLLDTSYSMDAGSGAETHFQEAIDAACAIVESTGRGSEISILLTGGSPEPLFDQPVFDPQAVVRRLKTIQAGYGASAMQDSLSAGLATLSGMTSARKELIVISDFQPADWETTGSLEEGLREELAAMSIKPELTFLQIGQPVSGNVSIESLDFSQRPLGIGHQLSVRANLKNHGSTAIENARVILKLDGAEQTVSQMVLEPNASTQALFPCTFDQAGSHVIEVEVAVNDALATDNRYSAAVTIWDEIKVLLIDGDPGSQPLTGESDFLSVALTPYSFSRLKLSDLVTTQTVTNLGQLNAELLADAQVVVLANVSRLNDGQVDQLTDYVRNGGALMVSAGNKIDVKWYNEKLFTEKHLMPAEFGMPRGMINETGTSSRIVAQHFDHPALQFFNDASNGDLSTAEIRQWYELITTESAVAVDDSAASRPGGQPVVMARLDSGDPFLVEQPFGDGVVMQLATACDADWSDLPMRPFYVPLMQQLVTTMATQLTPPRNIRTGEPAVALFDGDEEADATLAMVTPSGARRTLRAVPEGSFLMARFENTRRPGLYSMTTPEGRSIHFVASTSRDESDLTMLDEPQLSSLAENLTATVVKSPSDFLEQDRLRRHGREIWRYVLIGLLVFMFLELVLQQRFSRVRT